MRRLAGALVVLALGVVAGSASARPLAPGATCKAGLKAAIVGGVFSCLKVGQVCQAKHERDYERSGFVCRSGRLRTRASGSAATRAPSGPGSSRENPVLLGKPGALGNGWTLTITAVNPDATSAILAADSLNTAPLAGMQYVLISITATYGGTGSSHLTPGTSLHSIGASNAVHSTANSFCGKLPSPNLDLDNPLVFKGGTISGYAACWMVSTEDVASLEMYYEPLLSTTQVWFALH
jgi:hypothetical protein